MSASDLPIVFQSKLCTRFGRGKTSAWGPLQSVQKEVLCHKVVVRHMKSSWNLAVIYTWSPAASCGAITVRRSFVKGVHPAGVIISSWCALGHYIGEQHRRLQNPALSTMLCGCTLPMMNSAILPVISTNESGVGFGLKSLKDAMSFSTGHFFTASSDVVPWAFRLSKLLTNGSQVWLSSLLESASHILNTSVSHHSGRKSSK